MQVNLMAFINCTVKVGKVDHVTGYACSCKRVNKRVCFHLHLDLFTLWLHWTIEHNKLYKGFFSFFFSMSRQTLLHFFPCLFTSTRIFPRDFLDSRNGKSMEKGNIFLSRDQRQSWLQRDSNVPENPSLRFLVNLSDSERVFDGSSLNSHRI